MHKLIDYICDEMEQLEKKAEKNGKLSMQELQYADTLAHLKKNVLTADAMMGEDEYSNMDGSYARGRGSNARRDSMGRYSRDDMGSYRDGGIYRGNSYRGGSYERGYSRDGSKEDLMMQLRDMERDADDETKHMIKKWIKQIEEQ